MRQKNCFAKSIGAFFALCIGLAFFQGTYAGVFEDAIEKLFGGMNPQMVTQEFPISVDYSKTLADMVRLCKHTEADERVNSANFSIQKGEEKIVIRLIPYNEGIKSSKALSSEEIIERLRKAGLRPATLPELLAFCHAYPDIHKWSPIVALGTVSRNGLVVFLWGWMNYGGASYIGVEKFSNRWLGDQFFAAVHVEAPKQ